jgi:hypothetical protein
LFYCPFNICREDLSHRFCFSGVCRTRWLECGDRTLLLLLASQHQALNLEPAVFFIPSSQPVATRQILHLYPTMLHTNFSSCCYPTISLPVAAVLLSRFSTCSLQCLTPSSHPLAAVSTCSRNSATSPALNLLPTVLTNKLFVCRYCSIRKALNMWSTVLPSKHST